MHRKRGTAQHWKEVLHRLVKGNGSNIGVTGALTGALSEFAVRAISKDASLKRLDEGLDSIPFPHNDDILQVCNSN